MRFDDFRLIFIAVYGNNAYTIHNTFLFLYKDFLNVVSTEHKIL